MEIQHFFDEVTSTLSYLVHDGTEGVVVDPVRDYDPRNGRTSWRSCERVAATIERLGLRIPWVLDTHAHADHMTGLPFFRERFGARSATGGGIETIQAWFQDFYGLPASFPTDGRQFDRLLAEGDVLEAGSLRIEALHTPGHTPAHVSFRVGDVVLLGDTLFTPDYGAARCDFPGGSAEVLYASIQRLYALPEATRLFVCHDYMPGGRPLAPETTVGEQRRSNVQVRGDTSKQEFVTLREKRDAELAAPVLLLPAMQVNIRGGELPEPETNGTTYLKIPLNRLGAPAPDERRP